MAISSALGRTPEGLSRESVVTCMGPLALSCSQTRTATLGGMASSHPGTVRNPFAARQVFSLSSAADCPSARSASVGGIADASGSLATTYRPASHPSRSANRHRSEQNGRWGFSFQVVRRPHIGQHTIRPSWLMKTLPRRSLASAGESPR